MTYLVCVVAGAVLGWFGGFRWAVAKRGWKDHRYHVGQVPVTWRVFVAQASRAGKWTALVAVLAYVAVLAIRAG